jgi:DNA-binding response OmpR family regulator
MSNSRGLNVLVVGARGGLAESVSVPLRADGHVVGDVADCATAMEAAREVLPDVVVLDADDAGFDARAIAAGIGRLSQERRPFFIALAKNSVPERPPPQAGGGIDIYLNAPASTAHVRGLLRRFQSVVSDYEGFDPVI